MFMKIGVLVKDFEKLSNWDFKIIKRIFDDNDLELLLLIKDGRNDNETANSHRSRLKRLIFSKSSLSKLLFRLQISIERRLFKENNTIDKANIINKLKTIDSVYLKPKRDNSFDVFSSVDAGKIKSYNLDIILKHEFKTIKGDILSSAKYGIWSLLHEGSDINFVTPKGLWVILFHQTSVRVTLQQLTSKLNSELVIDNAFFNYHWSYIKTKNMMLEASISLLFKNIRQLQISEYIPTKSSVEYDSSNNTLYFKYILKYIFIFYFTFSRKVFERMKYRLIGTRYHCWTLFIGKGDFLNTPLTLLKPIILPKDEFWADPFLFKYKDENYVFFENFSYSSKRGKISCGIVRDNELIDITDVLSLDYHLSYPFIFEENGEVFLMPETYANDRLEIYKCIIFPNKWELYSTAFEGEKVVDASIYVDDNKNKWLFINRLESELFIYKIDSLKLNHLESHAQNPVIINSETARNGGPIFKYKDEVFRPSQANIEGVYGRALNINKIEKLTIDEYIEKTIVTEYPDLQKGFIAMHHLHQSNEMFVIDAAYKKI